MSSDNRTTVPISEIDTAIANLCTKVDIARMDVSRGRSVYGRYWTNYSQSLRSIDRIYMFAPQWVLMIFKFRSDASYTLTDFAARYISGGISVLAIFSAKQQLPPVERPLARLTLQPPTHVP